MVGDEEPMQVREQSRNTPWATGCRRGLFALALAGFGLGCADGAALSLPEDEFTVPASAGLSAVWGSADDDVWIVGDEGTALHYDGAGWSATASGIADVRLHGVHGSGPDDVWAVGGEGIVLHWDGIEWSERHRDEKATLLGIWAGVPGSAWAIGVALDANSGVMLRFGEQISGLLVSQAHSLWDIWGSSENDVWAVGSGAVENGFLMRGDGKAFGLEGYEGPPLRAIWGSSEADVWVAPYEGAFQHWDGSAWHEFPMGDEAQHVSALFGASAEDVWAIGRDGLILHWDGTTWEHVESDTEALLNGGWASSAENAWAVGADGTVVHWNGTRWRRATREPTP
jgi:hypothetical protein